MRPISKIALSLAPLLALSLSVNSLTAQQPAQDSTNRAGRGATLPLATTRTIKYTTDEGTWLSLDVSPDDQTIVFDLVGDIYTLPIAGGKATRITDGPA